MMASLYQSGSSAVGERMWLLVVLRDRRSTNYECERRTDYELRDKPQDVRGADVRLEPHVVPLVAPRESLVGKQVVHRVRPIRADAPVVVRDPQPAVLRVERVQV